MISRELSFSSDGLRPLEMRGEPGSLAGGGSLAVDLGLLACFSRQWVRPRLGLGPHLCFSGGGGGSVGASPASHIFGSSFSSAWLLASPVGRSFASSMAVPVSCAQADV